MAIVPRCGPPTMAPFVSCQGVSKNFVVDMGARPERVAIDRLKPAHPPGLSPYTLTFWGLLWARLFR